MADWWEAAPLASENASGNWWDSAPLVPSSGIADSFDAASRAPLRITVGGMRPESPPSQQLLGGFLNQGSAASQGTTPNIGAQMPQLISSDLSQNDAGEILYRDPRSGQLVPTDQNKHVALRDPADNRVKLFARTPGTDEGALSSLGRILSTGAAVGAPTKLAGGAGMAFKPTPAPSIEALKSAATAGYNAPEVLGLEIQPRSLTDLAQRIQGELSSSGIADVLAPKTFAILGKAEKAPPGATVTGQNLETLRRMLGEAAGSADATERKAAMVAQKMLDEFRSAVPARDVIAGDPAAAAATVQGARANYGAAMRAQTIDRKLTTAELRAAAANSGMNVGNTIRQRIADILVNPAKQAGYSADELAQMKRIVEGTRTQNIIRGVGNLLGGGGGLGAVASAAAGAMATGGPGAIAPVVGYGLKMLQNSLSLRQVEKLSELIRSRSPLAGRLTGPITDWTKVAAGVRANPTPRAFAQASLAARNLANNLKDAGIAISPSDLLRSLQGPMQARPSDEQQ